MRLDGDLASGWHSVSLNDVAEVIISNVDKKSNGDELPVRLCNYTNVYYNDYIDGNIEFMQATATAREIERFSLRCGDVIITKDSETADDIAVPALVTENLDRVLCGYHLAILRPRNTELSGAYLHKLLSLHTARHYFFTLANGVTRYGLTTDSIRSAAIPLPPVREQEQIAEILHTCDRVIEQAEKLVATKRRLRHGLMQKLLTGKIRVNVDKQDK